MSERLPTDAEAGALAYVVRHGILVAVDDARGFRPAREMGWTIGVPGKDEREILPFDLTLSGYDALIRWLAARRVALEKEGAGK